MIAWSISFLYLVSVLVGLDMLYNYSHPSITTGYRTLTDFELLSLCCFTTREQHTRRARLRKQDIWIFT